MQHQRTISALKFLGDFNIEKNNRKIMGQFVHKFGYSDTEIRGTRQYCLSAYSMSSTCQILCMDYCLSSVRQTLLGEHFIPLIARNYPAPGHTVSEVRSKSAWSPDATSLLTSWMLPSSRTSLRNRN